MASNVVELTTREDQALGAAARRFLDAADLTDRSRRVYGHALEQFVEALSDRAVRDVSATDVESYLSDNFGNLAPATFNRHRATLQSFFRWAGRRRMADLNPVDSVERRRERKTEVQRRRSDVMTFAQLQSLWKDTRLDLRDRTLWAMLYETAARANEILSLNIEDLDLDERSARIVGKGGHAEQVVWATTTTRLLKRLLGDRTAGPVFVGNRRSRIPVALADMDSSTGRARLSYRRAAEIFKDASGGRTLHEIRYAALTHYAEAGVDAGLLKAKSRHSSLRSLERYVNPSQRAVAELTARLDPERRH